MQWKIISLYLFNDVFLKALTLVFIKTCIFVELYSDETF